MSFSRKSFLKLAGLGAGAVVAAPFSLKGASLPTSKSEDSELTLGMASYSLRGYDLTEALAITNRLQIKNIALKSMHMPMDSTDAQIKAIVQQINDAGINLYGAGVIYMKSKEEVENAFRYAKAAQIKVIIGVPNHDLLPLVEKKIKETDIKLAIHNHGPGDDLYPSPESVYEQVKPFDKRMGLCIDIGHTVRIGQDPAENIKKYADRLYDLHLKDVNEATAEGSTVEIGRGVIDITSVLNALMEIKYSGVMALEFEKDEHDVLPGLAESNGYVHGVLNVLDEFF